MPYQRTSFSLLPSTLAAFALNNVSAELITWNATGTVEQVSGSAFTSLAQTADTVELQFSYSPNASGFSLSRIPFPNNRVVADTRFFEAIELTITILINENVWAGNQEMSDDSSNVILLETFDGFTSPTSSGLDKLSLSLLESMETAEFLSFPQNDEEELRMIEIEITDNIFPYELFSENFLPDGLTQVTSIVASEGSISAGSSTISFSLDPNSFIVSEPQVPVEIERTETESFTLNWFGEQGVRYRLDTSNNLRDWSRVETETGDGEDISIETSLSSEETTTFFRVVQP